MYFIGQNFIFASDASDVINSNETVLHSNPDFQMPLLRKIAPSTGVTYSRSCNKQEGQGYNQ